MTLNEAAGGSATVKIEGRTFVISPLTLRQENVLYKQLEDIARDDDAKRLKQTYAAIDKCESPEGRAIMWQEVVRETKRGNPLSSYVIEEARSTVSGAVAEMFARTREAHADIKREDFAAIINAVNAPDVKDAIDEALRNIHPN